MEIQIRTEIVNLHNSSDELIALQVSDVHVWFSNRMLEKIEIQIREQNPDLVIFTGDYADTPRGAKLFSEFVRKISTAFPTVFIRGNHDFLYGRKISNLLMEIPNCFCVEHQVFLFTSKTGKRYNFASWELRNKLDQNQNAKNIALIHNPEKLKEKEFENIDLILAGHLHGGQFIFCKTKKNFFFPGNLLYRYCTDRKEISNTSVIVSKGLGDTFPFRWNCPKEIVKLIIC